MVIQRPNSHKVVEVFDMIQEAIGIEAFKQLFPAILTDRDSFFQIQKESKKIHKQRKLEHIFITMMPLNSTKKDR